MTTKSNALHDVIDALERSLCDTADPGLPSHRNVEAVRDALDALATALGCPRSFGVDEDEPEDEWVTFTRRTEDPKLAWLEGALADAGIRSRRAGESFHAPILEVPKADLDAAWAILEPVDDTPDDDPSFG